MIHVICMHLCVYVCNMVDVRVCFWLQYTWNYPLNYMYKLCRCHHCECLHMYSHHHAFVYVHTRTCLNMVQNHAHMPRIRIRIRMRIHIPIRVYFRHINKVHITALYTHIRAYIRAGNSISVIQRWARKLQSLPRNRKRGTHTHNKIFPRK